MCGHWPDWTWEVIPPSSAGAHLQMALEEVLLTSLQRGGRGPTVRFWEWEETALVLGSHQSLRNEVDQREARRLGVAVTRRLSGGGTMLVAPGRVVTYSLYAPVELVRGMSFVASFAHLDGWVVAALRNLGVDASHEPINDIRSPSGKIGGAAQARRAGVVLHHTVLAHSIDPALVPRLIRIGRRRRTPVGLRSAEKTVTPLADFLALSAEEVSDHLAQAFGRDHRVKAGKVTAGELEEANELVRRKYGTEAWVRRLP